MKTSIKKLLAALLVVGVLCILILLQVNRYVIILIENKSDDEIYGAGISYWIRAGNGEYEYIGSTGIDHPIGEINDNRLLPFNIGDTLPFIFPPRYLPDNLPEDMQIYVQVEMSHFSDQHEVYEIEQPVIIPLIKGKCCIVELTGNAKDGFMANYSRVESGAIPVYMKSGIWW